MNDFMNNLAYEIFSILLVVFLVVLLYVFLKRRDQNLEKDQDRDN